MAMTLCKENHGFGLHFDFCKRCFLAIFSTNCREAFKFWNLARFCNSLTLSTLGFWAEILAPKIAVFPPKNGEKCDEKAMLLPPKPIAFRWQTISFKLLNYMLFHHEASSGASRRSILKIFLALFHLTLCKKKTAQHLSKCHFHLHRRRSKTTDGCFNKNNKNMLSALRAEIPQLCTNQTK